MTIPTGHQLGHPERFTNGNGLTIYRCACGCGISIYGTDLPQLWRRHDLHLAHVKAGTMRRHPSRGES